MAQLWFRFWATLSTGQVDAVSKQVSKYYTSTAALWIRPSLKNSRIKLFIKQAHTVYKMKDKKISFERFCVKRRKQPQ